MMKVSDVLRLKGTRIASIRMSETVATAAHLLLSAELGALVVKDECGTEGNVVVGMFTRDDLARVMAIYGRDGARRTIASLISVHHLVSCGSNDTIEQVRKLMTTNNIYCVPVIDDHNLIGVVSMTEFGAAGA